MKSKGLKLIAELDAKIKANSKLHNPIFNEEQRLKELVRVTQVQVVLESGMLTRRPWEAVVGPGKNFRLDGGFSNLFPEMNKLLNDGWGRYSVELGDGVELAMRDNHVSLNFRNGLKGAAAFIYKHHLPVSTKCLDDQMHELNQQVSSLRSVQEAINKSAEWRA